MRYRTLRSLHAVSLALTGLASILIGVITQSTLGLQPIAPWLLAGAIALALVAFVCLLALGQWAGRMRARYLAERRCMMCEREETLSLDADDRWNCATCGAAYTMFGRYITTAGPERIG